MFSKISCSDKNTLTDENVTKQLTLSQTTSAKIITVRAENAVKSDKVQHRSIAMALPKRKCFASLDS